MDFAIFFIHTTDISRRYKYMQMVDSYIATCMQLYDCVVCSLAVVACSGNVERLPIEKFVLIKFSLPC